LYSKAFWLFNGHRLRMLSIDSCRIRVNGLDMFEGTPILAIKPYIV
jgi:tRNA (Thr-GGU) A37 N-methylase